jgi:hypothetical protein
MGNIIFDFNNTYQKTPPEPRVDGNGKKWYTVVAHAALTAKTPYKIILDEYGYVTAALTGDTGEYMIGFPAVAIASGAIGELQVFGYCASIITASLSVSAGHALKIKSGAVADAGADYSGAKGEFAVNVTATTTSTTHNVFLTGQWIEGSDTLFADNDSLVFGSGSDVSVTWDSINLIVSAAADDSLIEIGDSAATQKSFDIKWYANEASGASYVYFDASANLVYTVGVDFLIGDDDYIKFGNGTTNAGDVTLEWDTASATDCLILAAVGASEAFNIGVASHVINTTFTGTVTVGVDDTGYDVKFFGATSGSYVLWDESGDQLILGPSSDVVVGTGSFISGTSGTPITRTYDGDKAITVYSTCASTNASTSFEPVLFYTTLTGAGQVGGRVRAFMTANVALGGWSNAFKGEVTYGASGSTTGLGSAVCAEMTLSAGTTSGNYAPLEVELNLGSGAAVGTRTSYMYLSANGADIATFQVSGYLMNIQGLGAATAGEIFDTCTAAAASHSLRIIIGDTPYYILLNSNVDA